MGNEGKRKALTDSKEEIDLSQGDAAVYYLAVLAGWRARQNFKVPIAYKGVWFANRALVEQSECLAGEECGAEDHCPSTNLQLTDLATMLTPAWAPAGNKDYPRMSTIQMGASLSFLVNNTRFLRINGSSGWDHGEFQIDISPPPPGRPGNERHWASESWNIPNTTFYAAALHPEVAYTVTLTNLGSVDGRYKRLDVHSVEMWPG